MNNFIRQIIIICVIIMIMILLTETEKGKEHVQGSSNSSECSSIN